MGFVGCVDPGTVTGWVKMQCSGVSRSDPPLKIVQEQLRRNDPRSSSHVSFPGDSLSYGTWNAKHFVDGGISDRFGESSVVDAFSLWARKLDVLVMEDFILRRSEKSRSLLSPVRLGAMMEREWLQMDRGPVVWQSPADKSIYTDQMLREAGLWIGGPHVMDAVRHLCLWLARS